MDPSSELQLLGCSRQFATPEACVEHAVACSSWCRFDFDLYQQRKALVLVAQKQEENNKKEEEEEEVEEDNKDEDENKVQVLDS